MQSFKQYLQEEIDHTKNYVIYNFKIAFNISNTTLKKLLLKQCKELISNEVLDLNIFNDITHHSNILFDISKTGCTAQQVDKIKETFVEILQSHPEITQFADPNPYPSIVVRSFNNHSIKLEANDVLISFKEPYTGSIQYIHKSIKSEYVTVYNAHFITAGAINLIQLKLNGIIVKIERIESAGADAWIDIIKKYLNQPHPDLLECKEELINAGYKEQAKL